MRSAHNRGKRRRRRLSLLVEAEPATQRGDPESVQKVAASGGREEEGEDPSYVKSRAREGGEVGAERNDGIAEYFRLGCG